VHFETCNCLSTPFRRSKIHGFVVIGIIFPRTSFDLDNVLDLSSVYLLRLDFVLTDLIHQDLNTGIQARRYGII
jgi:hypothetical protein